MAVVLFFRCKTGHHERFHAKTDRKCEKPLRIGTVWSVRLDIQQVRISIAPFGLTAQKSTPAGESTWVWAKWGDWSAWVTKEIAEGESRGNHMSQ
ncbi:hypothetical protein AVEN_37694-1 [Araneus ventricosus]|uniref:Uncharacterized protein n=1 Tax=Araneus ventricosus TaxID=182803 RepID=A0A4Y2WHP6_ARAVE|nr:hypothetical protein AVEN_37694-1 [Araneus ventricosus]